MNSNIKNRDEIEDRYKWNLGAMYKSLEEVKQDMAKVQELLEQFKNYGGRLDNRETILEALLLQDQ